MTFAPSESSSHASHARGGVVVATLATPPVPLVVPARVFDAFGWCDSDTLEWRRPAARWDAAAKIDGSDPSRMVFVTRGDCSFLPRELARLHAFGLGLADEQALAPWAIDAATDELYAYRGRPRDLLWLAADNLNALFWGLHDWAHFHAHGPFDERAWTELQCDASALAWLWVNREVVPALTREALGEVSLRVSALAAARFAAESIDVSRAEVDRVLTAARGPLCSARIPRERGRSASTETTDSLLRTVARRPT